MKRRDVVGTLVAATGLGMANSMETAAQSLEDAVSGPLVVHSNGEMSTLTNDTAPVANPDAMLHLWNVGPENMSLRVTSHWSGTAAEPYQNNDSILSEVFNRTTENSRNRSWGGSFANAYNDIPAGVRDNGERTGVLGWAVSVAHRGYKHDGTLVRQTGIYGRAGFQGDGSFVSGTSAVIETAIGVKGEVLNDSPGAVIQNARAGEFTSASSTGSVQTNIAVYAYAANGLVANFSFYGSRGKLFNQDQIIAGSLVTQSGAMFAARHGGNSLEFGNPDPNGYACNIGATYSHGIPFLAFSAEADPSGNTFRTRGKRGSVIHGDLAGGIVFSRVTDPNANGQALAESACIDADGRLGMVSNPPSSASAPGRVGAIAWDANHVYVCVAPNSWKRTALSSW